MRVFEKYLSGWVLVCMALGVLVGKTLPAGPAFLGSLEWGGISLPMTVLIWIMIYPMMLKVDFESLRDVGRNPKGLYVTWVVNWLIKPFSMYGIAYLFFHLFFRTWIPESLADDYLAGAVLLGVAPCTAMVFVWSYLTKGNSAYTVVQVATNDLIILIAFVPIVKLLLEIGSVEVPWKTLFVSVFLFVVIPLAGGILTRLQIVKLKGKSYFENIFLRKFDIWTMNGLLLTLVLIFAFQANAILSNPFHIVLISIPLTIQTILIFLIAFSLCRYLKLGYDISVPAGMIGASNFFELALAVAVAGFGLNSPVVLATTVGVLVEVPVMLMLVKVANIWRERGESSEK